MDIGMLWFDNDPKTDLTHKVNRAAAYYLKKYGENPDICFVNPEMMSEEKVEGGQVAGAWDLGDLHDDLHFDAGVGLRGMLHRVVCRLDVAAGEEGVRITALVGHPF